MAEDESRLSPSEEMLREAREALEETKSAKARKSDPADEVPEAESLEDVDRQDTGPIDGSEPDLPDDAGSQDNAVAKSASSDGLLSDAQDSFDEMTTSYTPGGRASDADGFANCPNCGELIGADVSPCPFCNQETGFAPIEIAEARRSTEGTKVEVDEEQAVTGSNRRQKKLSKDPTDKKIAGVASGVAKYFELDTTLVRAVWVVAALVGFGVPLYLILWIVLEDEPAQLDG